MRLIRRVADFATAAQPSGSKLPRHKKHRHIQGDKRQPWPDAPTDTFAALGHWGQAMYVIPSENLVIVRYGDDRDGSYRHNELLKLALKAFTGKAQP